MNIVTGMIRPGQGSVHVLGERPWNNARLHRRVGYCSQSDHFYENFSGLEFLQTMLALGGEGRAWARRTAEQALEMVNLSADRRRPLRAYSKGMRQRTKIALALARQPEVLVLDEPFNGLDPVGRHQMMDLFKEYSREGRTILVSSHILHEIEQMTDRILMMSNGYVLAEGEVTQVRDMLRRHPFKVLLRCNDPRRLAALMLAEDSVLRIELEDERTVTLATRDPDRFYLRLNAIVLEHNIDVDLVTLADENMASIYHYLSGREHH